MSRSLSVSLSVSVSVCVYVSACVCVGSSGQVSPSSTVSGPTRPSPIHFDDIDVPDVMHDLTAAIQSTYGQHHVTSPRDPTAQGHAKTTSADQGHGRNVLEELSYRLQQGRKSRDPVTSRENDVIKLRVFGVDDRYHDNSIRSTGNYPLLVVNLHLICISLQAEVSTGYTWLSRSNIHF